MGKIEVTCPNCGAVTEVDEFALKAFCSSCGSKIEVPNKKSQEPTQELDKQKLLLHRAYEARDINDVFNSAKKVMEIYPNDILANFLYDYCLLRKGNKNGMINFLKTFDVSNASEEDIDIILSELVKTRNYYEEKCAFIDRVKQAGYNVSKYSFGEKKEEEVVEGDLQYKNICRMLNKKSTSAYLLIAFIISVLIGASQTSVEGNMAFPVSFFIFQLLFMLVTKAIILKRGYDKVMLIITLVVTGGIYVLFRLSYARKYNNILVTTGNKKAGFKTLFMHGKV